MHKKVYYIQYNNYTKQKLVVSIRFYYIILKALILKILDRDIYFVGGELVCLPTAKHSGAKADQAKILYIPTYTNIFSKQLSNPLQVHLRWGLLNFDE